MVDFVASISAALARAFIAFKNDVSYSFPFGGFGSAIAPCHCVHLFPLFLLVDVLLYRRKDSNLLSLWRQGYSLLHLSVDAATVCPLMFIVSGVETSRRASQQCALLIPCLPREVEDQVEMDGFEPSIPRRVRRLHLPRFIPRKPNHHSHAVRELGVSLSLYQVTVLRVLHGIRTHVAWLVENIKLSRIVCINGLCQARD